MLDFDELKQKYGSVRIENDDTGEITEYALRQYPYPCERAYILDPQTVWDAYAMDKGGNEYVVTWDFGISAYVLDDFGEKIVIDMFYGPDGDRVLADPDDEDSTFNDITEAYDFICRGMEHYERIGYENKHYFMFDMLHPDDLPWDGQEYITVTEV